MSDRIATHIRIGGPILHRLAIPLAETISNKNLSLDWGSKVFSPTNEHDLITAVNLDDHLFLCNDQTPYGYFENLEAFLHRHHIAFDRHSEAKYEYDAELVSYRPGMRKPFIWTSNQNEEALVSRALIASTLTLLDRHKTQQALRLLQQAIGPHVAPLQPLSFIGRKQSSPSTIETSVTNLLGF
jgi:hypothetical protein